ncbi:hypothetical protein Fmac_017947 [Flemingia macrophylla]|uniref:Reverse transcriptase n=1 Tax=Flemingia macrophylla TaxID=520843 RepID=A0ABD1M3P7_9FABA
MDVLEETVLAYEQQPWCLSPLEKALMEAREDMDELEEKEIEEYLRELDLFKEIKKDKSLFEELKMDSPVVKQEVELKMLPPQLKYVFLEADGSKPVIISSHLTIEKEKQLIEVLRNNKEAIGWTLADLKGISPSYCMHKIHIEQDYMPIAQPQRRLNPMMKEVVKKEVLKLLEVGIIYPISDSAWVSPVQVVPKKGGITVVQNEKNELIPPRIVTG